MSESHGHSSEHSRTRYYIIMTVVVIAGLFVLLLFNNSSDGFGFTSAVIENVRNNSIINSISDNKNPSINLEDSWQQEKTLVNPKDINFKLSSSKIPQINKEVKLEKLELVFNDLTTSIKVNEDKLELSALPEVIMEVEGFKGIMSFDEDQFSLDGVAKRLEINDISLSTNREIKISFSNLQYQLAKTIGIEFKSLDFVSGEGNLKVRENLNYDLEDGQVITAYNFIGDLDITKDSQSDNSTQDASILLEGYAKGLDIVGGALNLNLR
jgi:hypothetical protein